MNKYLEAKSICEYTDNIFFRLADIKGNEVEPFYFDDQKEPVYENRERLYCNDSSSEEQDLVVLNWEAEPNKRGDGDYILGSIDKTFLPIQIIIFLQARSIEEVYELIQTFSTENIYSNRFLFCHYINNNELECLYLEQKDFSISEGQFKIKDEVYKIPVSNINQHEILKLRKNKEFILFENLKPPETKEFKFIKEPNEIIKRIFSSRFSWPDGSAMGLPKSRWQELRDILQLMPEKILLEEIEEAFNCNKERAVELREDFYDCYLDYVDNKDINDQIFSGVVNSNKEVSDYLKAEIRSDWEIENKELIKSKESEIEELKEEYNKINIEKQKLEEILKSNEIKIKEKESRISELNEVYSSFTNKFSEKIKSSKNDIGEFVSDVLYYYPFLNERNNFLSTTKCSNSEFYTTGSEPSVEPEICENWNDIIDIFSDNLEDIGIAREYSQLLATYFYTLFRYKKSIVLIGPFGWKLSEVISLSLTGKNPGVLDCNNLNKESLKILIESSDSIIIVKNFFTSTRKNDLLEIFELSKKMFILQWPFKEDLLIEPKDIFNYIIPFFTGLFLTTPMNKKITPINMSDGFEDHMYENKNKNKYRLKSEYLDKFKKTYMNDILSKTYEMYEEIDSNLVQERNKYNYVLCDLPFGYYLTNKQILLESIDDENSLNSKVKEEFETFIRSS